MPNEEQPLPPIEDKERLSGGGEGGGGSGSGRGEGGGRSDYDERLEGRSQFAGSQFGTSTGSGDNLYKNWARREQKIFADTGTLTSSAATMKDRPPKSDYYKKDEAPLPNKESETPPFPTEEEPVLHKIERERQNKIETQPPYELNKFGEPQGTKTPTTKGILEKSFFGAEKNIWGKYGEMQKTLKKGKAKTRAFLVNFLTEHKTARGFLQDTSFVTKGAWGVTKGILSAVAGSSYKNISAGIKAKPTKPTTMGAFVWKALKKQMGFKESQAEKLSEVMGTDIKTAKAAEEIIKSLMKEEKKKENEEKKKENEEKKKEAPKA
jgi:hypothetical protein